ncbi:MAG: response regulator [Desulfobacteraceae bacterium]|nr:response regulator [Desulfobacteraceae bacterium]
MAELEKKEEEGSQKQYSNISILFVDDDTMAQKLMSKFLKDWNIYCASSGQEALETMEEKTYAVVLLDYQMPGMDGIELLKRIKKRHSMVQVVMITGSDELNTLITSLSEGADDFILKPVKKETLFKVLGNTCGKITRWTGVMKTLYKKKREKK